MNNGKTEEKQGWKKNTDGALLLPRINKERGQFSLSLFWCYMEIALVYIGRYTHDNNQAFGVWMGKEDGFSVSPCPFI